jgi:chorismate synthase
VHDRYALDGDTVIRTSNRGGGTEGGISTGEAIIIRAAMKPISTTLTPLDSVDLASGEPAETRYERSDVCAVPRAAVVGEAMMAFILADAMVEKVGGDNIEEMLPRYDALRQGRLDELAMDNVPWQFGYDAQTES